MTTPFDGLDPDLIGGAIHEAGHAVAATLGGFTVTEITIHRNGNSVSGFTRIAEDFDALPPEDIDAHLITIMAGGEAEARFLTAYCGYTFLTSARDQVRDGCCSDMEIMRRTRKRHPDALSVNDARHRARVLITRHWPRIERLGCRVARHHRLALT